MSIQLTMLPIIFVVKRNLSLSSGRYPLAVLYLPVLLITVSVFSISLPQRNNPAPKHAGCVRSQGRST